jgi:alpha-beta hydrolase superfamily lysophospholipase
LEKVWFTNSRGERLAAVFQQPECTPGATLIITHGFRGSKEGGGRAVLLGEELVKRGYGVFRFDFSGVGESEGDFSEITLARQVDDLLAAVNWVLNFGTGPRIPLVGLGRSFGGSTLLAATAKESRIAGVCLWSTPFDLPQTFRRILGEYFTRLELGETIVELCDEKGVFSLKPDFVHGLYHFKVEQVLSRLSPRPVLIIHGENDEVVDVQQAKQTYALASQPKSIHIIPKGDHQFLQTWEQVWRLLFEWLDQYYPVADKQINTLGLL